MSATITWEFMLLSSERRAIFDPSRGCHRFYYGYEAVLPFSRVGRWAGVGHNLDEVDLVELTARYLRTKLWIKVDSPTNPFPNNSLVFVRGRMVSPSDESIFVLNVEVFFASMQQIRASIQQNSCLPILRVRPEPTIVGKVLSLSSTTDNSLILCLEAKDAVIGTTERFLIG